MLYFVGERGTFVSERTANGWGRTPCVIRYDTGDEYVRFFYLQYYREYAFEMMMFSISAQGNFGKSRSMWGMFSRVIGIKLGD